MRPSIFARTALLTLVTLATLAGTACVEEPGGRDPGVTPRSLDGTDIDGSFTLDAQGKFQFDEHAQLRFEYFLTADEELSPAELDAWVEAELQQLLPIDAQADAIDAWHSYLSYREQAAAALTDTQADPAQLEQRLLGAVGAALGDAPIAALEREQLSRSFALSRAFELQGPSRELALAELGVSPGASVEGDAARFLAGRQLLEQAAEQGASPEQIQVLRREQFGPEAADRLAALDAKRAAWDERVRAYEGARAQLDTLDTLDSLDQLDQAGEALAAEFFSPSELRRLRALEQQR